MLLSGGQSLVVGLARDEEDEGPCKEEGNSSESISVSCSPSSSLSINVEKIADGVATRALIDDPLVWGRRLEDAGEVDEYEVRDDEEAEERDAPYEEEGRAVQGNPCAFNTLPPLEVAGRGEDDDDEEGDGEAALAELVAVCEKRGTPLLATLCANLIMSGEVAGGSFA